MSTLFSNVKVFDWVTPGSIRMYIPSCSVKPQLVQAKIIDFKAKAAAIATATKDANLKHKKRQI